MTSARAAMLAEYRRELRKVLNRITKLQEEGYVINRRNIPKPKADKDIRRRDIERLQKYKEKYIKNLKSTKYRTREGRMVSGAKGEEIQRSEAAKKGWRERRWREEINRFETIKLGDALIDAIHKEIEEGIMQISIIKNLEQKQGYWSRCMLIRGTLDGELASDPEGLKLRLGKTNQSAAVERTQIACRYDRAASEAEAWSAALELLNILRGKKYTVKELKQIEEGDYDEWFEEY